MPAAAVLFDRPVTAYRDATVAVVDDCPQSRATLCDLLHSVGLRAAPFSSALEFLSDPAARECDCLLLDVRMPGMSGLELQEELHRRGSALPVVFVSDPVEIPVVTRAMRGGALDFLPKPVGEELLLERVHQAVHENARRRRRQRARAEVNARLDALTVRERAILERYVLGESSHQIGEQLGISAKTVDNHRSRILEKMQAESLAQLVARLAPMVAELTFS